MRASTSWLPTIAASAVNSSLMRLHVTRVLVVYAFAFGALAGNVGAQQTQVQRCEARDGTVTYSNRECPAGSTAVRKVNTSPAVSVPEQQAAKERAKKDAAEVKQIDKDRKKQAEEEKRAADKRNRNEMKIADRCERARRDLARAIELRNAVDTRAATVDQMRKASQEVSRREAELPQACPP